MSAEETGKVPSALVRSRRLCVHVWRYRTLNLCDMCWRWEAEAAEKRAKEAEEENKRLAALVADCEAEHPPEPWAAELQRRAEDAIRERDEARAQRDEWRKNNLRNHQRATDLEFELAASKALTQRLRTAMESVQQDIEVCDWHCSACGLDQGMGETDIAFTVRAALAESPDHAAPEGPKFHPTAVAVTLTGLIRQHLKNCLRTIRGVDCPDLLGIVAEWASKIATQPDHVAPAPEAACVACGLPISGIGPQFCACIGLRGAAQEATASPAPEVHPPDCGCPSVPCSDPICSCRPAAAPPEEAAPQAQAGEWAEAEEDDLRGERSE